MLTNRFVIIFAILAVALSGCVKEKSAEQLSRISALVKGGERAAAIAALDSIDEGALDPSARAYAHYLRGISLDEYSSIDKAVLWVKQALMEASQSGNDSIEHEAALYLAYLSNISGNSTLAVNYGKKALSLAEKHDNPRWIGSDCLQLSGSYFAKGMKDSSDYYIDRLIPLLRHQAQRDLPDMLNNIAVSCANRNDLKAARGYLERSLSISPNAHTYYLMAETFDREGCSDSAEIMWRKALTGTDLYMQARISESYSQWLRSIGEHERAGDMMMRARMLKDSLDRKGLSEAALTAHTSSERQILERRHRSAKRVWVISLACLGCMVVGLWAILRARVKKTRSLSRSAVSLTGQLHEMEAEMTGLKNEIDILRGQCDRHNRDARDLEVILRAKSKELRRLEEKYASKESEIKDMESHIKRIENENDEIMSVGQRRYAELTAGGKATTWSKKDMMAFVNYYHLTHPAFAKVMREEYSALSPTLAVMAVLIDMKCGNERIQEILGMSAGAFRTARSRLNASRV